jgi:hypothetical protein
MAQLALLDLPEAPPAEKASAKAKGKSRSASAKKTPAPEAAHDAAAAYDDRLTEAPTFEKPKPKQALPPPPKPCKTPGCVGVEWRSYPLCDWCWPEVPHDLQTKWIAACQAGDQAKAEKTLAIAIRVIVAQRASVLAPQAPAATTSPGPGQTRARSSVDSPEVQERIRKTLTELGYRERSFVDPKRQKLVTVWDKTPESPFEHVVKTASTIRVVAWHGLSAEAYRILGQWHEQKMIRSGIVGDPSNMISHVAAVDKECAAAFAQWQRDIPIRAAEDVAASVAGWPRRKSAEEELDELAGSHETRVANAERRRLFEERKKEEKAAAKRQKRAPAATRRESEDAELYEAEA